jgi:hypothetical protein
MTFVQTGRNITLYTTVKPVLNQTSLEPNFLFGINRCLAYQVKFTRFSGFPTLGLYIKFSLSRILVYSGFSLDRFYCIYSNGRNITTFITDRINIIDDLYIFPLIFTCDDICYQSICLIIISLFSNMTL